MDLQQFCENLKSARLYQKMRLEDVARETRIPAQFLTALEEANWHLIPTGYLHGYLSSYAGSVGMNLDRVMESFEDLEYIPQPQPTVKSPPLETHRPRPELEEEQRIPGILEAMPLLRWALISCAAAVFLLIVGGLFLIFNRHTDLPVILPDTTTTTQPVQTTAPPAVVDSSLFVVAKVNLALTFTDSCYLKVSTEDSLFTERIFFGGDSVAFSAEGYFNVLVGNPQAADIYFNGKNAGRVGQTNRPAHLLVDPAGIRHSSLQE